LPRGGFAEIAEKEGKYGKNVEEIEFVCGSYETERI